MRRLLGCPIIEMKRIELRIIYILIILIMLPLWSYKVTYRDHDLQL